MAARPRFYLDKRNAKWKGVCAGIADYTGIDVTWVRLAAVVLTPFTHLVIVAAYFIIAWVAQDRPADLYANHEDERFWQGVRSNTRRSAAEVRSQLREVDRRLAALETFDTTRHTGLASEIDRLR